MGDEAARIEALEASLRERDAEIARLGQVLDAARDRLTRLFQANPVPLFVVDPDGVVTHANRRARRTLGLPADAAVGHPLTDLIDPAWHRRVREHLHLARTEDRRCAAEAGLRTRNGKALFARIETTPIDDAAGRALLVAVLVLTGDAENLRLVGDSLDASHDRVRAASEAYERR